MFIEFEGVKFAVKRIPRKRNITISLKPNGVARISASLSCPQADLESFLNEKRDWIKSVQQNFEELRQKHPPFVVRDGLEIPLLGQKYRIAIKKKGANKISLRVMDRSFVLSIPSEVHELEEIQEELRYALRKHFKKIASELLPRRIDHWVKLTGLTPTRISFRGQRTRWGSCSHAGSVCLNWKLICAEPEVIDYVIVHELCHLRHLNHSPRFWQLVEVYCPNWREKKKWLRTRIFDFDFLNQGSDLHRE